MELAAKYAAKEYSMNAQQNVNKTIITYLILVFGLSAIFYIPIIAAGSLEVGGGIYVLGLMWMPAVAALITALIYQHSFRGLGWKLGKPRYLAIGYLLPLVYSLIAYCFIWIIGLGAFSTTALEGKSLWSFLLSSASFGVLTSLISATGEEIGWRGLLVPQLAKKVNFVKTALISGVIWVVWHAPLILMVDYNSGTPKWFALLCFSLLAVGLSFPFAWLRLASGSFWPAALMHASHNLFIQQVFDKLTSDTGNTLYFSGEFGIILALLAVALAFIFSRLVIHADYV